MIVYTQVKELIGMDKIKQIEDYIKLEFPKEYKEHLIRQNGGRCKPNVFEFVENGKSTTSNVDWFLAIYDGKYNNLKNYIDIYKLEQMRLPTSLLPVAHDSGGNLICISCNGEDKGFVYFWDHEKEVDYTVENNNDYSNLYLIQKSFNSFISNLKE